MSPKPEKGLWKSLWNVAQTQKGLGKGLEDIYVTRKVYLRVSTWDSQVTFLGIWTSYKPFPKPFLCI